MSMASRELTPSFGIADCDNVIVRLRAVRAGDGFCMDVAFVVGIVSIRSLWKSGVVLLVGAVGCDLPRDPGDTLERVRNGTVRVGIAHNPPWVVDTARSPAGVEPAIVTEIARQLGARIEWIRGAQSELLTDLRDRKLDLVVGGLTDDLPWKTEVAFTRSFYENPRTGRKHVMAAPPGENAWLVYLERELHRFSPYTAP